MNDYNRLAAECHANNAKWWHDLETGERLDRNKDELLMLVVSEIAEAMEGERKGLMDDKLPHRPAAEVELVDAQIRLLDFAGAFFYNVSRPWDGHTGPKLPNNKGAALLDITHKVMRISSFCDNQQEHLVGGQIFIILERIQEYADRWGYDLAGAYEEKTAFNKVRKDHSVEHRKAAGGKKW